MGDGGGINTPAFPTQRRSARLIATDALGGNLVSNQAALPHSRRPSERRRTATHCHNGFANFTCSPEKAKPTAIVCASANFAKN